MEGYKKKPRTVHREFWGILLVEISKIQGGSEGKTCAKTKDERGRTFRYIYEGLREKIGTKTCLHDPMDYTKTLKLRFRVGDLNLPER